MRPHRSGASRALSQVKPYILFLQIIPIPKQLITQLDLTLPYKSSVTKCSKENSREEHTTGSTWGTLYSTRQAHFEEFVTRRPYTWGGGGAHSSGFSKSERQEASVTSCAQSPGQRKVGGCRAGRWHRGRRRKQPCSTRPSSRSGFPLLLSAPGQRVSVQTHGQKREETANCAPR